MTVPVSAAMSSTQQAATTAVAQQSLDYDAFLRLLLAQMQNQDPLQPMESTEYVAQLATFSNVEQGLKMNDKLEQLLFLGYLEQANNVVGRTITSADGSITGVVASVKLDNQGAIAVLENGQEVAIDAGIRIS